VAKGHSQRGIVPQFGAKSLGMGSISSTLDGADALFNNFSQVTSQTKLSAIVSSQRRFSLSELTSVSAGFHLPLKSFGHFGLAMSSYGFEDYKEQKMSLMYSRKIKGFVSLSANFDYNILRITEHGSQGYISFGLGLSGDITKTLSYGLYIFTPEKIEILSNSEVPTYLQFGVSNQFSDKLTAHFEIEKIIDEQINFKTGIDLMLISSFYLRAGFNTHPSQVSFGLGYSFQNFMIDGAVNYDTLFGTTPGVSLKYQAPTKK